MILTNIDGVPLYSTLQEALQWAAANGLQGYHTHIYQGSLGYMGGTTHGSATIASGSPTSSSTQPTSSGSTSSSGGGGGY